MLKRFIRSIAFFAAALALQAQETGDEIKPPFALTWGESSDTLEKLLKGAKATIVLRKRLDANIDLWEVNGLVPQSGVKRTIFRFRRGELIEVELEYQKDDWDEKKYDDYMNELRRVIDRRYGPGQQIVRRTEQEGDATETLTGYKWNKNNTAIELFYFQALDSSHSYRMLSVHYKGY